MPTSRDGVKGGGGGGGGGGIIIIIFFFCLTAQRSVMYVDYGNTLASPWWKFLLTFFFQVWKNVSAPLPLVERFLFKGWRKIEAFRP